MTFYDRFFSFSPRERGEIAVRAGLSLQYLLKHIYVSRRAPRFHLHNAVALDRASSGALPFYEFTHGSVDWAYVHDRLREAAAAGQLRSHSDNTSEVDGNTPA
jgi:hypothetical protein